MNSPILSERKKITGMTQAILAAFTYGWMGVFAKLTYQHGIGATELLSYRFGLSALSLWTISLVFARRTLICRLNHLPIVLAMGVLGYAAMSLAYFSALKLISASLAALILSLMPSTTTLLARFFFQEPLTPRKLLALIVTFTGACLIIGFQVGPVKWRGILFALFAVLVSALYSIIGQGIMRTTPPRTVNLYVITAAGVFFSFFHNPLSLFSGPAGREGMLFVLLLIGVSTIPPVFLFLAAIEKIGSARTMMLGCGEPLMAVVAAYLVLGERLTPPQLLGGAAIVTGFFLVHRV